MPEVTQLLTPKQKALAINLDQNIYGTFAEIGAGQETVRHFFRAGGASQTIAKAMSAYDKDYSNAIYGAEEKNRFVSQARLKKMLSHEIKLIEERLDNTETPNRKFFSYANTVTTINYHKTFKGHGWVGLMFQHSPDAEYSEIIIHIKFKENESSLQQETLGNLGVNLIYGAFNLYDNPRNLIKSLYDDISVDKIEIDMIHFEGPAFPYIDNRLMSLQLVKKGMTDAVVFNSEGQNMLPADILYKKNLFAIRGSFRPVTLVNIDMFENGLKSFLKTNDGTTEDTVILFEITTFNLRATGEIDERDFLDRVDILAKLGYTVLVSNFAEYYKLTEYFSSYNVKKMGIAMGVNNLQMVFDEEYYQHLPGGILEAFGKLFKNNVTIYLYPYKEEQSQELLTSKNLKVQDNLKELYKYFIANNKIINIEDYNPEYSEIYSREILAKIANQEGGWENQLPNGVADMIKERGLFGYKETFLIEEL